MQGIVLAAGHGTGLEPLTATRPKGMIPLAGKPILYHVLSALKRAGVSEVIFVVKEFKDQIINYFDNGKRFGLKIKYVEQDNLRGTAHAVACAAEDITDDFIVIHGDLIF